MSFENNQFEQIQLNKRGQITIDQNPELNRESIIVTKNSIDESKKKDGYIIPFSDSDVDLVSVTRNSSLKIKFGYLNDTILRQDKIVRDSIYIGDVKSIQLSIDLVSNNQNINYPFIFDKNSYEIDKLGTILDPFGIYNEIKFDSVYDNKYYGFKASVSKSGIKDSRKRNIELFDYTVKNNKEIENYDDTAEMYDLLSSFKEVKYREGNYLKLQQDNSGTISVIIDETKTRYKSVTSKESRFFEKDNNNIEPFFDRVTKPNIYDPLLKNEENRLYLTGQVLINSFNQRYLNNEVSLNKIYNSSEKTNGIKYNSHGYDEDYLNNAGIESINYRGILN